MPSTAAQNNHLTELDYAAREEERFSNFYEDILSLHELLDQIQNISLRRQFRDIINKVEDDFSNDVDFTTPRCSQYNTLRLGAIGGSLSGKTSLIQRFITGTNPKEDLMPGKHKKTMNVCDKSSLLLIRDETGPPDYYFSLWADAVVLVFSVTDEHSFNVISSYYAKMVAYRNETTNLLPCILVAIKDDNMLNDNLNDNLGVSHGVSETKIKKFIAEHRNCPYFEVSLESGENVNEVFQTAAEKITILQNLSPGCNYEQLMSASFTSLNTIDGGGLNTSYNGSQSSLKKNKRRNTLFSLKGEKKEKDKDKDKDKDNDVSYDDIGSGRSIPIKQGYLYKKSTSSLKEWKKKYVIITDDQKFSYYSSMKDYMGDGSTKAFKLIHATVKTPGKRGSKPSNQSTPQKGGGHMRSLSSNNLLAPSPSKTPAPSSDGTVSQECCVISNNTANDAVDGRCSSNGSPTIQHDIPIGRSASDSKDYVIASGIRNALSYDSFPTKRKYKNRNKSCEFDYHPDNNDMGSDIDGILFTPSTPVIKKKMHRRQKSSVKEAKELAAADGRATDTEDVDYIFTLVYIDGRILDFECNSMEERDSWVATIENQILKAFERQKSQTQHDSDKKNQNGEMKSGVCAREELSSVAGNEYCADCQSKDPEWASLNLGILICIECSGVHRNLGSHLSRVRSVLLDDWPPETMATMRLLGNSLANSTWEANLGALNKISPSSSREEREWWITNKYEKKEFLLPLTTKNLSQDIFTAVRDEHVDECYKLLISSTDKDVNKLWPVDDDGGKIQMSPLHMSCLKANIPLTQLLLWYRGDPRMTDSEQYNPIYYAHKSNSKECAELLYQYGSPDDTPC